MSGVELMTTASTPRRSSRMGDVAQAHPLAQSRTTRRPAPATASASTPSITDETYSSAASSTAPSSPMRSQGTTPAPSRYSLSMASSCSLVHSVPSAAMHLMPLNSGGLWDAVIITPPVTSSLTET